MKIDVTKETKNPLLERREVYFNVSYRGPTPKLAEVRKELCEVLKAEGDLLVVDYVKSEFGRTSAKGFAKVYENLEARGVEPQYLVARNFDRKKKKVAGGEAPAEGGGEKAGSEAATGGGKSEPGGEEAKAEGEAEESKPEAPAKPEKQASTGGGGE